MRKRRALDDFGVEYLELSSPVSSEQSRKDCEIIASLGLRAKILTYVRCNMHDARIAVETGVDGVDVVVSVAGGKDCSTVCDSSHHVDRDIVLPDGAFAWKGHCVYHQNSH